MTYFLLDLASCTTTVHTALGSARTVCGSQLMRGSHPVRRLCTSHFYCPFLVCCALSWVIKCVCVCVCVCTCTNSLQAGFPNRFLCVFCTSLRYFWRIPTHMLPKSVSFSFPLACSSCLALKHICCHCHSQHVFFVSPGSVYRHLVKYGFSSGASIWSRTLPWILSEQIPSTMKCSGGQLRNNGACCARENVRVRFQLRTALRGKWELVWSLCCEVACINLDVHDCWLCMQGKWLRKFCQVYIDHLNIFSVCLVQTWREERGSDERLRKGKECSEEGSRVEEGERGVDGGRGCKDKYWNMLTVNRMR